MVLGFLAFKKYLGRIEMRTRDKKYLGRIRSFETSPDAIEPELRTALCERRQTDGLKTNYSIDGCSCEMCAKNWHVQLFRTANSNTYHT